MSRSCPWQRTCSDLVFWRQTQAQNATIYILRETGPTGFLLKEEGEAKPCKAFLGDPHSCTCSQFLKDRDLCKHICWLLLKKFRVSQTNPMSWQKGLVEREINQLLRGITEQMRKKVPTAVSRWRRPLSRDSDAREPIPQRDIADDDVCPICQDEFLAKRLPVTYCKFGCGNSIHIKCMKVWAEHQKSQGETVVKCPFCREDFGPFELLKYENRNAEGGVAQGGRMDRHIGTECQSCHMFPIEGKCYRCSFCADFYLCQSCFNTPIHTQHAFQYRHKRNQRWRAAQRAYGAVLPQAVVDDLVNREISENDYDLLMQLDSNTQVQTSDIPEDVIQGFPMEKVRENGPLLAPGIQCRVCLRAYQVGQLVRKLPRCKHKFHKDCIDNWLLHSKPTCPIDGQVVWTPVSAQMEGNTQQNRPKKKANSDSTVQSSNTVNLEIPGIGLTLQSQSSSSLHQSGPQNGHQQTVVRGRPPIRRRGQAERETDRVLQGLRGSFSLSGMAVGQGEDSDIENQPAPGGRLLHYANFRRNTMNQRLSSIENTETSHINSAVDMEPELATASHEIDPLEQVIEANSNHSQPPSRSPQHDAPGHHINRWRNNAGSLFAQETPGPQIDVTANLLANAERISPYREIPNVFSDAVQQIELESVRTNETCSSAGNTNSGGQSVHHQNMSENHASNYTYNPFMDIAPEQRLFADNPHANPVQNGTQSSSHILFNQTVPVQNRTSGEAIRGTVNRNQGRQLQGASSAPAVVDGADSFLTNFRIPLPERGRREDQRWSQNQSTLLRRSSSRDRSQERVGRVPQRAGGIPKEGENLLERLALFSDIYLGNNPVSHPPASGTVTTATGLPPRPSRQQFNKQAAARQRRYQNERRRDNFSLEGSAFKDVTLRDLL